jgi:YebC/PmpR family DNA-binding regulatory protein
MAGHSHWANIARKKAVVDAKRGKLWSKLAKAIIVAAKHGGGDPDANLRLRYAIDAAKAVSMPKENITRAIKAGTGELKGGNLEESLYEGYAAGGVAVLCEILTDNRNRTAPEIRKIFELCDGKLGASGCVGWMFERRGVVRVPRDACGEDRLVELALEAGAEDVTAADDCWEIRCEPGATSGVVEAVRAAGLRVESSEIIREPSTTVDVENLEDARKVLQLMERLDEHDDVQAVAANFNIPDESMAEIEGSG